MHKTLIVAQSEFTTLVKTKAFLVSLILMPKRLRPERGPTSLRQGYGGPPEL
jgi:hypothetical protein